MAGLNGVAQPEALVPEATSGVNYLRALSPTGASIKVKAPFVSVEDYGAVADGETDDLVKIQDTLSAAHEENIPVQARGAYFTTGPIVDDADGEEYWDQSTTLRPQTVFINKLITSSTDAAFKFKGSGAIWARYIINDISGPGMNVGDLGTPGGGDERIGVLIEGFVDLYVRSIQDFNKGICGQELFSSHITYGWQFACHTGLEIRPHPITGMNSQKNTIRNVSTGGIFTGPGGPNDAYRRSRGSKIGAKLRGLADSRLDLQIGYVQLDDTCTFIDTDSTCKSNTYWLYLEGARADGVFGHLGDENSHFYLEGMGSPNDVKSGQLDIDGAGSFVYGLPDKGTAAARTGRTADQSAVILNIGPSVTVVGSRNVQNLPPVSSLNHSIVGSVTTWTDAGPGSVTLVSDGPSRFETEQVAEITTSGTDTQRYTSQSINISGETSGRTKIKVVGAVRGVTSHARIAYYILNAADDTVIGKGITEGLASTSAWKVVTCTEEIPAGVTAVKFELCVRNTVPAESGCVVRMRKPWASFNIETEDFRRVAEPLSTTDTVKGRVATEEIRFKRPSSYDEMIVTDLTATAIATAGRAIARVTAHPSGNTVNGISGLRDNSPTVIINDSSVDLTIANAAGEWAADFTLAVGQAMTVIQVNSKVFRMGSPS